MQKIFIVDWALLPAFLSSALTGIVLHTVDPVATHDLWHNLSVAHVVTSALFTIAVALHVQTHRGWYKAWARNLTRKPNAAAQKQNGAAQNRRGKRRGQSPVTRVVTLLFLALLLTGLILLPTEGGGTPLGLWHFRLGLLATLLFAAHIAKRLPRLLRPLRRKG